MIIREQVNGMYHTYSSIGMYIHGGFPDGDYEEAYDPVEREYTETDIPIPRDDADEEADYAEAGRVLMGVIK
jgi:hypothetical protein